MWDLHIHTFFSSDGIHSPTEIYELAKQKGLKAISFTDHNDIEANYEGVSLSNRYNIKFVPGVEFNSFFEDRDVHILGYFIDYKSSLVEDFIANIKSKKLNQTKLRTEKLRELGFYLTLDDVLAEAKGRPATGVSFLKAILKYERNLKDKRITAYISGDKCRSPFMNFYNDFLCPGKPAFVPLKDADSDDVIDLILRCKGIPIIAHPRDLTKESILKLKSYGAMGLEVFSTYHDKEKRDFYLKLSEELKMVITGGSDFHGLEIKKDVLLGEIADLNVDVLSNLENCYKEFYGEKPCCL